MASSFYLDTAIWRDYFEDRHDRMRPLGEFAFQFLKKCEEHDFPVLYSGLVVHELAAHYSKERIKQVFSSFNHFLVKVPISNGQIAEAKKIASRVKESHLKDILHTILARDNEATMVTRDRHFEELSGIAKIVKPEEVIFD